MRAVRAALMAAAWLALLGALAVAWFAAPLEGPSASLGRAHGALIAAWLLAGLLVFAPRLRRHA